MTLNQKTAVVFGGTGFIGRQIVRELARQDCQVKVATRVPERAYFLRPYGTVGQVVPFPCDYSEEGIKEAVSGCDYVVNCIGILSESKKGGFQKAHVELPKMIAKACMEKDAERFVHISALSCDKGGSKYARSKKQGEEAIFEACPGATILRPSVVFGPGDEFFNMFAKMAQVLPALPLIGGGKTKFQPVYVGDVADAVMACLSLPEAGASNPAGHVYELGGPDTVTFKEIYRTLFKYIGTRRALVPLPFSVAKVQASFMGVLPNPPLTRDQVESLKTDNVVQPGAKTLHDLGLMATEMKVILPEYLERYRPGGRRAKPRGPNPPVDNQTAA